MYPMMRLHLIYGLVLNQRYEFITIRVAHDCFPQPVHTIHLLDLHIQINLKSWLIKGVYIYKKSMNIKFSMDTIL